MLLAQMGSFVPAKSATIGLVDAVLTRVGSADDLAGGRSTFMVEMEETAEILKKATEHSLLVLDEIGRGTSTFDGLAIAWAVAEFIAKKVRARTLLATHYHEMVDLARTLKGIKNLAARAKELGGRVVFLHTITEGAADRSYGIDVAVLAGLPEPVIKRAREVLHNLEMHEIDVLGRPVVAGRGHSEGPKVAQLELFTAYRPPRPSKIEQELKRMDPDRMTPLEALQTLYRWKKLLEEDNDTKG